MHLVRSCGGTGGGRGVTLRYVALRNLHVRLALMLLLGPPPRQPPRLKTEQKKTSRDPQASHSVQIRTIGLFVCPSAAPRRAVRDKLPSRPDRRTVVLARKQNQTQKEQEVARARSRPIRPGPGSRHHPRTPISTVFGNAR